MPACAHYDAGRSLSKILDRTFCGLIICSMLVFLASCGYSVQTRLTDATLSGTTVTIDGSDTMSCLMDTLSKQFMKERPGIRVSMESTDSGDGLAKLFKHKVDIAATSRDLTEEENSLADKNGLKLKKIMVARDAIVVIVNPANKLAVLTLPELRAIYLRQIRNWQSFDGKNEQIKVFTRESESGTSRYFKSHVLKTDEYPDSDQVLNSQELMIKRVSEDPASIGYVSLAKAQQAAPRIKIIELKLVNASSPGVEPSKETLVGDYPLGRPLYLVFEAKPNDATRLFVDFCSSSLAKRIISDSGFVGVRGR
jgi:phosphate transport system substrate-binding protein